MNLECGPEGSPNGGLLRAGEILSGHEWAHKHRPNARNDHELAKGPARLATALGIDRRLNGIDVCAGPQSPLAILTGAAAPADQVLSGPRTGVRRRGRNAPVPLLDRRRPDGEPVPRAHPPPPEVRRAVRRNLTPDTPAPNVARAA